MFAMPAQNILTIPSWAIMLEREMFAMPIQHILTIPSWALMLERENVCHAAIDLISLHRHFYQCLSKCTSNKHSAIQNALWTSGGGGGGRGGRNYKSILEYLEAVRPGSSCSGDNLLIWQLIIFIAALDISLQFGFSFNIN
ncbi:hypothetical protein PoB_007457000 [Plakobranchus ocellatus]|uniref:Uncharacterized protein n=1 Tax=Plakobranchus ocellatus TaxID=259542 RepID=A0AAV4DVN7_9GAST|nr:hypothetical protein PoB_007457000 [Plakobranchus ocellatus]